MSAALPRRRAVVAVVGVVLALAAGCAKERAPMNPDPAQNQYAPALGVDLARFTKRPDGLYVRDDTVGTGAVAEPGRTVEVHYTGWLADGHKFDSSRERGEPLGFVLGQGDVIRGWDLGLEGMRVGGRRTLVVPAELGYKAEGSGSDIPPNAVLVFRTELVSVR
jgi:FKBP-type peptidyl-prolyl cis-trans isomerase